MPRIANAKHLTLTDIADQLALEDAYGTDELRLKGSDLYVKEDKASHNVFDTVIHESTHWYQFELESKIGRWQLDAQNPAYHQALILSATTTFWCRLVYPERKSTAPIGRPPRSGTHTSRGITPARNSMQSPPHKTQTENSHDNSTLCRI